MLAFRLGLVGVFLISSLGKLVDIERDRSPRFTVSTYCRTPGDCLRMGRPVHQLACAAGLLFGVLTRLSALGTALMSASFFAAKAIVLSGEWTWRADASGRSYPPWRRRASIWTRQSSSRQWRFFSPPGRASGGRLLGTGCRRGGTTGRISRAESVVAQRNSDNSIDRKGPGGAWQRSCGAALAATVQSTCRSEAALPACARRRGRMSVHREPCGKKGAVSICPWSPVICRFSVRRA